MKTVAVGLIVSTMLLAFPALAQVTPGPLPRRHGGACTQTVPDGAILNLTTGLVTLDGATVPSVSTPCTPGAEPQTSASGGYYTQFATKPLTDVLVDGVEELQSSEPNNPTLTDNFGGFFNVPEAYPTYNGSKTPEYWDYWIGLVAWNWPNEGPQQPGGNVVLQPVFTWQEQYTGGPHAYYMFSDMAIAGIQGVSSFKEYSSGVVEVYLGDRIESFIYQYESNPDAWQVRMDDLTTGAYAQFLVTGLPSTWPKFNTAYLVLEGFDGTTAAGPLPNCADLPSSGLSYELATFDAPPNYTPSTPNWSGAAYPATTSYSTTGPNCNFGYEYSGLELTFTQ